MGLPIQKTDAKHLTYADYCTWSDDERWELIHGAAYNMSPAPLRRHQHILRKLLIEIGRFLEGKPCEVYPAPFDVRLPERDEPDDEVQTVVQPDLSVICDHAKLDDRGCRGGPDFIIEILSSHTASKDRTIKRALYERHNVKEYWIVDPDERSVTVYRLRTEGRYGTPESHEGRGTVAVKALPGLAIDLTEVFAE